MPRIALAAALVGCAPVHAQWLNYPTPGVPRLPNGKPNLNAPTPRTADGEPDPSGLWEPVGPANSSFAGNSARDPQFADVGKDVKGGLPLRPWAADLLKTRLAANIKDDPDSHCLPNEILTIMSGLPLTLTTSAAGLNLPGANQTVDQIAPVVRPKGIGSGAFWFNPASFASPAPLTFGNTGINIFDGPGFFDLDFSLFKNVALNERFRLQLRAEAFNSTNTPEYGNPGTSFTSSTFGKVTGYCSGNCGARDLQLGVKLLF